MKSGVKQLIRMVYEDYVRQIDCVQMVMEGYLGCLHDLGLMTYEEYRQGMEDIIKAEKEA